jgi:hypothetical protein
MLARVDAIPPAPTPRGNRAWVKTKDSAIGFAEDCDVVRRRLRPVNAS